MCGDSAMRFFYEDRLYSMNIKLKGNKVLFADEALGCKMLIHKNNLPNDITEKLTSAYIITGSEDVALRAFKCSFAEEEKTLAFSYKRFPEFWRYFCKSFGGGKISTNCIDLSLLNSETRRAELKNDTIVFASKNSNHPNISKLQSLRDNPDVLFILDKRTNTLHDKSCEELKSFPLENLEVFQGYLFEEYCYCKKCRDRFHIRLACGDDFKHFDLYKRFLSDGGLSEANIEYYIRQRDFNMRFVEPDVLQIKVNEDTWRIKKNRINSYTLLHNNYRITDSGERYIGNIKDYHIQCHGKSLVKLFDRICFYSYEKHLESITTS